MLLEILGAFVLCDIVDSIKNIGKKLGENSNNYQNMYYSDYDDVDDFDSDFYDDYDEICDFDDFDNDLIDIGGGDFLELEPF